MISIKILKLPDFGKETKRRIEKMNKIIRELTIFGLKRAIELTHQRTKKPTGRAAASLKMRIEHLKGFIFPTVYYFKFIEWGTRPSIGRYVPAIGKRIKTGMHPGFPGYHILRDTIRDIRREVQRWR